jgi:hypothetical protein
MPGSGGKGGGKGGASPAALGRDDEQIKMRANFTRWAGKRTPYPKSNMPPAKVIFKKSS